MLGPILEAANGGGATKTRIMYKAFLSYTQLKENLTILLENGLLEYEERRQLYRTTEKDAGYLNCITILLPRYITDVQLFGKSSSPNVSMHGSNVFFLTKQRSNSRNPCMRVLQVPEHGDPRDRGVCDRTRQREEL